MKPIHFLFSFFILCILFTGCKRTLQDAESIGPEIISVPSGFQTIGDGFSINSDSIDLSTSTAYFISSFPERVSWTVKIIGLESEAEKILQGVAQNLDVQNSSWTGESDNINILKLNEKAVATLSFYGTNYVLTDTFVIKKAKNYPGILISDFEGNGSVTGWTTFWTPGKFIDKGEKNELHAPQGNYYYHLKGNDYNGGTGVGGMNSGVVAGGFGLSGNPENIYLNVYINGIPNTKLDLRIFESDGDAYTYGQQISWTGWKLVSVPYTDFLLTSTNQVNGQNPELANQLYFLIKSSPAGNMVEANVDYVLFTSETPFEP